MQNHSVGSNGEHISRTGSPNGFERGTNTAFLSLPSASIIVKYGAVSTDCEYLAVRKTPQAVNPGAVDFSNRDFSTPTQPIVLNHGLVGIGLDWLTSLF